VTVALVAGAIANKPRNGGEAWVRLSWILGLRRLGFDVYFVECLARRACVDAAGRRCAFADSVNRSHFEDVVARFGLAERAALLDEDGRWLAGIDEQTIAAAAAAAEVAFNISGHLAPGSMLSATRRRVYVDLDPGFTQVWHSDPELAFSVDGHDDHVTVGLSVGRPECRLPSDGVDWIPTLPPIVLSAWPAAPPPASPLRFTTVSTWRSPYGRLPIAGRLAGLKHHEFRRFRDLPRAVDGAGFELALDIEPADVADLDALRASGWSVVSPVEVAASAEAFAEYVRASGAEFSVAQGVYVESRCGWFSDRTAAYLASGRPALVQETGIGGRLPLGEGLLTFSTPAEAAAGARRIVADPSVHAEAARALAVEHLDSDRVLGALLDRLGIGG
jgi:hypothetical protein